MKLGFPHLQNITKNVPTSLDVRKHEVTPALFKPCIWNFPKHSIDYKHYMYFKNTIISGILTP